VPGTEDVDFVGEVQSLCVKWTNVFSDSQSGIQRYRVGLGTFPGTADVVAWQDIKDGQATTAQFADLTLPNQAVVYFTVHAYNDAGLSSFASSDGVQADLTAPMGGHVRHGPTIAHQPFYSGTAKVAANWNGFADYESAVVSYEWCISTVISGECDIKDWTYVGLQTRAASSNDFPEMERLQKATKFYVMVRATNGRGAQTVVASSVITLDMTDPIGYTCNADDSKNLVADAGFESPPKAWISGRGYTNQRRTHESHAFAGTAYLLLDGNIRQSIALGGQQAEYELEFHARNAGDSMYAEVVARVHTKAGALAASRTFPVPVAQDALAWRRYSLTFATDATNVDVDFTARTDAAVRFDGVSLRRCVRASDATSDVFELDRHYFSSSQHVQVSWSVEDEDSGIHSFQWAVGTVPGGQQVSQYANVGQATSGETTGLSLVHGARLYFSLLATNHAGRMTVFKSTVPATVDLSPPYIHGVHESGVTGDGVDRDFVRLAGTSTLYIRAMVSEPESGLALCECAVGSLPGAYDVASHIDMDVGYLDAKHNSYPVTCVADLSPVSLPAGTLVYAAVRCRNGAGLASHASSDGVVVLAAFSPITSGLTLTTPSKTVYNAYDPSLAVQNDMDRFSLAWTGDMSGVTRFNVIVDDRKAIDVGASFGASLTGLQCSGGSSTKVVVNVDYEDGTEGHVGEVLVMCDDVRCTTRTHSLPAAICSGMRPLRPLTVIIALSSAPSCPYTPSTSANNAYANHPPYHRLRRV